jgi:hypothetical protein
LFSESLTQNIHLVISDKPATPGVPDTGLFGEILNQPLIGIGLTAAIIITLSLAVTIRLVFQRRFRRALAKTCRPPKLIRAAQILMVAVPLVIAGVMAAATFAHSKTMASQVLSITTSTPDPTINLARSPAAIVDPSGTTSAATSTEVTVVTDLAKGYDLNVKLAGISNDAIHLSLKKDNGQAVDLNEANQNLTSTTISAPSGDKVESDLVATVPNDLPAGDYTAQVEYEVVAHKPPVITNVFLTGTTNPAKGALEGGVTIDIIGENLAAASTAYIDLNRNGQYNAAGPNETCANLAVISDTHLSCTVPSAQKYGHYDVAVIARGGEAMKTSSFTYDPPEEFKFTIDTRMTDTKDTDPNHYSDTSTSFVIPVDGTVGTVFSQHVYDWIVNCGGGQADQVISGSTKDSGIPCSYPEPGEYQITIKPNGTGSMGWMNAFGFQFYDKATNLKVKSIDTPLTNNMRTHGAERRFAYMFTELKNATSLPEELFSYIETSTYNFTRMFEATFLMFGYNSTAITIPAGLFAALDTSKGTHFDRMFFKTFGYFGTHSLVASIPEGLFDSINTERGVVFTRMFERTFWQFSKSSTIATVPTGLFKSLKLLRPIATGDRYGIFCSAFEYFASANKANDGTPDTDINDIWAGITFSSEALDSLHASMFELTFRGMKSLVGTAQTFIDDKLGGFVPRGDIYTFRDTSVSDLGSLHPNWK